MGIERINELRFKMTLSLEETIEAFLLLAPDIDTEVLGEILDNFKDGISDSTSYNIYAEMNTRGIC